MTNKQHTIKGPMELVITTTREDVIERQKAQGTYRVYEYAYNPYNVAYWSGHVIEEICEVETSPDLETYLDEIADVIIFFQNLFTTMYPNNTLVLDLLDVVKNSKAGLDDSLFAIGALRTSLPNRKAWKNYGPISAEEFTKVFAQHVLPAFVFELSVAEGVYKAYQEKVEYNKTREDWNRG